MEPEIHATSAPEFDFENERRKLKENLKLFDLVLEKRSEANASSEALEAKLYEQNQEQENLHALEAQILAKQNNIDRLKLLCDSQSAEYVNRPHKSESAFLCRQYTGAKKIEMLKIEIQSTSTKTAILELDLKIEQENIEKVSTEPLIHGIRRCILTSPAQFNTKVLGIPIFIGNF